MGFRQVCTAPLSLPGRRGDPFLAAGNFWGDTGFPTISSDWDQPSHSFALKLATTLSSTAVNEFQFSRAGNDIRITTNEAGKALNDEIASKFPTVFPKAPGVGLPTFWAYRRAHWPEPKSQPAAAVHELA